MSLDSLEKQLERLKEDILKMGSLLQEQIYNADRALLDKNIELAREVVAKDDIIDQMQLDIEQKALRLIALKQPMARDLRFLATALRIIVDIERMADHAEGIAKVAIELYPQAYIKPLIDIPQMAKIAQDMVQKAMNAFISGNVDIAMSLVPLERQADALYDKVFEDLLDFMKRDPDTITQATKLILVAGYLERIADHATNLGEMVIYMIEGRRIDINVIARTSPDSSGKKDESIHDDIEKKD